MVLMTFFIFQKGYCQRSTDSSKSRFHLFHPTPEKLMRDFVTDRPDATESPISLDAGHFQFETDLFKTERNNNHGIRTINNYYNAANFKFGITNNLDVQFIFNTVSTSVIKTPVNNEKSTKFGGNFTLRAKQNLWGNDGRKTAFAILPFLNFPERPSGKFSGGIVFPLAITLSNGWDLGTEIETDIVNDQLGNKYLFDFSFSVTTSHSLTKNLSFFAEGVASRNNAIKTYEYFLDGGLVYNLEKNINIDTGFYYGIKNISSKTYFLGVSIRI